MRTQDITLSWFPVDQDGYGDYTLAASANGTKFTIYPGSFFTLVARDSKGHKLFSKTANTPGALKGAATRYVRSRVSA
jgi:hypothetical protein